MLLLTGFEHRSLLTAFMEQHYMHSMLHLIQRLMGTAYVRTQQYQGSNDEVLECHAFLPDQLTEAMG